MTSVRLVSITKPFGELQNLTAEGLLAYIARVSNPSNQMNVETAPKLLAYCIKNKHWSVFEQISFTLEIKTSRGIGAQILRHRSFVFQEFSLRYSKATENCKYEARLQDDKNRQNSLETEDKALKDWFNTAQALVWSTSNSLYKEALEKGIAKEQARFLLPLSTETTILMTGSARSWIHYIELRSSKATQKEHRDIANAAKEIFKELFPATSEALAW